MVMRRPKGPGGGQFAPGEKPGQIGMEDPLSLAQQDELQRLLESPAKQKATLTAGDVWNAITHVDDDFSEEDPKMPQEWRRLRKHTKKLRRKMKKQYVRAKREAMYGHVGRRAPAYQAYKASKFAHELAKRATPGAAQAFNRAKTATSEYEKIYPRPL